MVRQRAEYLHSPRVVHRDDTCAVIRYNHRTHRSADPSGGRDRAHSVRSSTARTFKCDHLFRRMYFASHYSDPCSLSSQRRESNKRCKEEVDVMSNCSRSDLRGLLPQVLRALGGSRRRRSHQLRRPCWRLSCHGKRLAHEEASNLRIGDPHHLDQARAPSPAEQQLLLGGGRAVSLGRGGEVIGENPAALDLLCSLLSICCCPRCLFPSLSLLFSHLFSLSLSFIFYCLFPSSIHFFSHSL